MTKKLFLHVGAHRTGSTFIQDFMRRNRRALATAGVTYNRLHDYPDLRKSILKSRGNHELLQEVYSSIFDVIDDAISGSSKATVFSYEGFLGEIYLNRARALYPDTKHFCEALEKWSEKKSPDVDLSVGICIRSYDSFIVSTFKYAVRQGFVGTISEYLRDFDVRNVSWVNIVEELHHSTDGRILIWDFEGFLRQPRKFMKNVLELQGFDRNLFEEIVEYVDAPSNKTAGQYSVELQRSFNRAVMDANIPETLKGSLRASVNRHIGDLMYNRDLKVTLEDSDAQDFLKQKYKEDVEAIKKEHAPNYLML